MAHSVGPLTDGALAGVLRSSQNAVAALGPQVPVEACGNSLRSAGVPAGSLLPGVDVVPAAIAHLAERQWDGLAYVRL